MLLGREEETMLPPFADRRHAGRILGEQLVARYGNRSDVVVLGLPRGGIPVAAEVARTLGAPLDVFVVRKLGTPGREELAMGAIASGGLIVINDDVVDMLKIARQDIDDEILRERAELERREALYRGGQPRIDLAGKIAIVVDDGLATGSTMRAAVAAARQEMPARIVVAVPVGARSTCEEFDQIADECVCILSPEPLRAVGCWYGDFSQTTDNEVRQALDMSKGV
jgi:predicted phosphoribosyltransferase